MNKTDIADSFRIMGNLGSHFAHLTGVSISPDGRFLSSSDQNGVLVIRDAGNMFHRIRYYKATTSIRSITWMKAVPSVLLVGCGNGDAHVLILRETAPDFKRLEIQDGSISSITTSDRGSLVAMAVGDYIVLADQDPHALEKAWSNVRRIRPPAVTSKGEIPLIQNLHIIGDDVIIVSHFEAVFGIRAISIVDPFEELWRIPLQAGTYIGYSAISPSKNRMAITNTVSGLDIYSLKKKRYSDTVKYEVHRDRRIFGVAFLDENNIVAANEGNLVFAEVGQQEPEVRSILPSTDQEVLQLIAVGYIQDKPYIVATHNLLSRELREERCITVAHQANRQEVDSVDAEPSLVKQSIKPADLDTSPLPQFVDLASGDQAVERLQVATDLGAATLDDPPLSQAHQRAQTAAHLGSPVAVGVPVNPVAPVNLDVSVDHGAEVPRSQPWSPMIRTCVIAILAASMLFLWGQGIGSLAHRSLGRTWMQQITQTIELEASLSAFSAVEGNSAPRIGTGTVILSMPLVSTGAEANSEPHIASIADGLLLTTFGSGPEDSYQELRGSVAPVTMTQTRIETRVVTLTQVAISTVTETEVIERPPEAPPSRSNWSMYLTLCFISIIVAVMVVLIRPVRASKVPFESSKWANSLTGALKEFGVKRDDVEGITPVGRVGAESEARGGMGREGVQSMSRGDSETSSGAVNEEVLLAVTRGGGEKELANQAGNGAGDDTGKESPSIGTLEKKDPSSA